MLLQMAQAVQGGLRQVRKLEVISNHLANASTTGFKADILSFDEMLRANMITDFTQGNLKQTGNNLDVALADDGFFEIQTQRGIRYTRNGTFTLNPASMLVTQNGDLVLGDAGPITIQGTRIDINEAGEIRVDDQMVGKLSIANFLSKEKLVKEGESLFVYNGEPEDRIIPETISVKQGRLEMPNVSIVIEMTKMIETMRKFESCMKMIQAFDETDSKAVNDLARV